MADPIIVLDRLSKRYGSILAVNELSMEVRAGEIFGFLGANGAGKTTTIRMMCGLARPTGGKGAIRGSDIWRQRYKIRSEFGYVAQKFSLYPDLTAMENLRFFGGAYGVSRQVLSSRANRLLREMDITQKRDEMAGSLSGGQKQLLAMACALVHEPSILFLDEPTAGLDPVHRKQIWDHLYSLSSRGTSIFVTTHYMDEAERCTEVGFIKEGSLLVKDSPRALTSSFRHKLLQLHAEPVMPALLKMHDQPGVLGATLRSERIRVYSADPEELLVRLKKAWPIEGAKLLGHEWIEPDMEDVFQAYSQGYVSLLKSEKNGK